MQTKVSSSLLTLCLLASTGALAHAAALTLRQDEATNTLSVYRENGKEAILTQNARPDFRPYIHPIVAPDGKGVLTEYSPGHHKHQTGLYWGLKQVNGRDFFHNPGAAFWRKLSSKVLVTKGESVKWTTVYQLLDAEGKPMMNETQVWTMRDSDGRYFLDLEWKGEGLVDLTMSKQPYGGLFLRMPWKPGVEGGVMNSVRQGNGRAEAQRSIWMDVGMKLDGRDDQAHIAIFDHPKNAGYPQHWRVDGQMGVGPCLAITGDWKIAKGKTETVRHQFVVYTGKLNDVALLDAWKKYTGQGSDAVMWGIAKA